jgi:zinc/manganese transport system substrate-binding protein
MKKLFLLFFLSTLSLAQAQLKVAALHPLIGDLVSQVGGEHVTVLNLLKPGGDVHHFEPSARDIANLQSVKVIFASGKGLENYLGSLRDSVPGASTVEVGKPIPSIVIQPGNALFYCCPAHSAGALDPHWWHSLDNLKRAARVVSDALAKADPANAEAYKVGSANTQARIAGYKAWAQQQLSSIPRADRKLVTAHAAYGYFCKEFGFKSIPMLGVSREGEASGVYVTEAIKIIQTERIRAVFPEDQSNPKALKEIVRGTAVRIGDELVADGTHPQVHTIEAMIRHNVNAIVKALKP